MHFSVALLLPLLKLLSYPRFITACECMNLFLSMARISFCKINLLCSALVYLSKFPKLNQGMFNLPPRYKSISSSPTQWILHCQIVSVEWGSGAQKLLLSKGKIYLCWHDVALIDTGMWCLMYICVGYIASAMYVVFRNADRDMFVMYWIALKYVWLN